MPNVEQQAVEFGVESGEYRGACSNRCSRSGPTPERCVEGLLPPADPVREHRRAEAAPAPVDEDGNVEIGGRDLRQPQHLWMTLLLSSSYLAAEHCMVNHQHDDRANDCDDHAV
jgi:hypothetical protein